MPAEVPVGDAADLAGVFYPRLYRLEEALA